MHGGFFFDCTFGAFAAAWLTHLGHHAFTATVLSSRSFIFNFRERDPSETVSAIIKVTVNLDSIGTNEEPP